MRKVFKQIHLWLSVPFGILITLICFSGAMLVFEKEIMETTNRQLYYVESVSDETLPLDMLVAKVEAILPDTVQVTGITAYSNPKRNYQVSLSKPRRATMYIDPYTGEIKGRYERAPFFSVMFKMHRWLMGSARTEDGSIGLGKLVVGISTLMFVFVLISGAVIWWPKNRKVLKNRLSINAKKGWRRFWYDLHVAGGIYALILLLAMSLTGLTWSFEWYRNGFYKVFGVEIPAGGGEQNSHAKSKVKKDDNKQMSPYEQWQKVYEELAIQNPEYKQITVSKGSASVSFDKMGNQRAADKYTFDQKSGEITDVTLYKDSAGSSKIRGWIYSVHVGSWGGLMTRILSFLAALLGASLPLTGYYLWIKRVLPKHKRET